MFMDRTPVEGTKVSTHDTGEVQIMQGDQVITLSLYELQTVTEAATDMIAVQNQASRLGVAPEQLIASATGGPVVIGDNLFIHQEAL